MFRRREAVQVRPVMEASPQPGELTPRARYMLADITEGLVTEHGALTALRESISYEHATVAMGAIVREWALNPETAVEASLRAADVALRDAIRLLAPEAVQLSTPSDRW